ncbi:putative lipid II flippase FtsW [Sinomonas atrocyanea]|jgi:cell division protein FtsW|uniref:putative lipid II flippase FtsW n=1 Tax=Sinomonas atrocyanea TaxID=37927 RepID=UPI002864FF16|nr:putative lipid II flippase FtsW [Sinomonas atrocyanea]MDR6620079.1 cell division protein FtsW [Sinomonas atrocyanea]
MASPAQEQRTTARFLRAPLALWRRIARPDSASSGTSYFLILGATLALTAIGIMMVLSASSVESIAAGESPYTAALKQALFGLVGLVGMFVLSRINVRWLKRLAWPGIGTTIVLLVLVQLVGRRVLGNRNWIDIAGFSLQPSEFAKLLLALWMATILNKKADLLDRWGHALVPVAPVGFGIAGLVIWGHDLGTTLVILLVVVAALFYAGVPTKLFVASGVLVVVGAAALAVTSPNRMCRIYNWVGQEPDFCKADGGDFGYQVQNGLQGLASGGWLGVGLGQSRQKYSWIPEAHNDFIFAVLGEELGLFGTLLVLALFAVLAVAVFRVVSRQTELFPRILGGTIMAWILGQAAINMAMVTGIAPVIGVPLPFISSGGSALVSCLCAIGVVLSLAREDMRPVRARRPGRTAAQGDGPGTAGRRPAARPAKVPAAAGRAAARPAPRPAPAAPPARGTTAQHHTQRKAST